MASQTQCLRVSVVRSPVIPELLPYHSYDPVGSVFVQKDGSLGLTWELSLLECEVESETALGQIAKRIESLLALFPEGAAAQFILASRRKPDLDPWVRAGTGDGLLQDLAESRVRATRSFEIRHEGALFAARSLRLVMTLRTFPRWQQPGLRDGLRFTFQGAKTIRQKFLATYAAEKQRLLERAEAAENLLAQMAVRVVRLDLSAFRALVHSFLN